MTLIIVAILGFLGQIMAATIVGVLNGRNSRTNRKILESTHTIVNNERTIMLHTIAILTKRVANENPGDKEAQEEAAKAHNDYLMASGNIGN